MRLLEVVALAAAMFIVPASIHYVVQSIDETYEILGRRARSPYAPPTSVVSIAIANVLLVAWHVCLGRLSYSAIMEESDEGDIKKEETKPRRVYWGRVLGRIVVPMLLLSLGVHFVYQLAQRLSTPAPFITPNVIDAKEVERELAGSV
jgi:hypothetical protein